MIGDINELLISSGVGKGLLGLNNRAATEIGADYLRDVLRGDKGKIT